MKFANVKLGVLIIAILLTFNPLEFNSAQYQSLHQKSESSRTRTINLYDNSGSSMHSDASDKRFHRKNRSDDNFFNEYKRNRYSKNDDYIRDLHNRNNDNRYDKRTEKNHFIRNTNTGNYFHIDRSGKTLWDGKHWEITDYPLRIYISESSSRYYKPGYKDYVKYALDVWRKADDRINYKFVNSRKDADISLYFIEDLGAKYEENYLGLTEYDMRNGKVIDYSKIQISLIKFGDEKVSDGEIKATIIHELGHSLGLGHSDNEYDIMHPYINPDHTASMNFDELSDGDKAAIEDVINLGDEEVYVRK